MALKKYSKYIRDLTLDATPKVVTGTISFTETRCHFKLEEKGEDEIVEVEDDYVLLTHKNLTRSFHLSLFSLVTKRKFAP